MLQYNKLDKTNLTVKKGMFTKKVTPDDELHINVPNTGSANLNTRISMMRDERDIIEGLCYVDGVDTNTLVFKLRPTLISMRLACSDSFVRYWTDTAYFAIMDNQLYVRTSGNRLPFLFTNVYSDRKRIDGHLYNRLCVGSGWANMSTKFTDILSNPKAYIVKFLGTQPNTDLSFRYQYNDMSCTVPNINRLYKGLAKLQKDIKTPEEAAAWYNAHKNWVRELQPAREVQQ